MSDRRVIIIGAGLAGLSAGIRLAEHDIEVIVIETRRKLGGRATSFVEPRSGEVLDNCQHVLMGCCTNLIDFYDRLGMLDAIQWHRQLFWSRAASGDGAKGQRESRSAIHPLRAGVLPAPLHFAGSFCRFGIFSTAEKRAIARAMWQMIRLGSAGRLKWRDHVFSEFLRECQQPASVVRDFWNAIIVSACNLDVDRVSAAVALHVFQEGFLASKWSYTMGLPTLPLWELYDPALRFIEERSGQVRLGESVRGINFDGARITGVVTEHELIKGGTVLAAVPFDRLDKLISAPMREVDTRLQNLDKFQVSPILGVHLFFEEQVMPDDLPHMVAVGDELNGVQWLFNKGWAESAETSTSSLGRRDSEAQGRKGEGVKASADGRRPTADSQKPFHHVHAVISAADDWMVLDEATIVERVMQDIHRAIPSSNGLMPMRSRAVKEKRATFAATPDIEQYRPSVAPGTIGLHGGGIMNLFLAGDWTDTGWPATMEGAVRSGYAAAAAIAGTMAVERGEVAGGVIEDIPHGRLAAFLGLK